MNTTVCDDCGKEYGIGQSPFCRDAHAVVNEYHPFIPRFDIALGKNVTSLGERWKFMREKKLDYAPEKRGEAGWEV